VHYPTRHDIRPVHDRPDRVPGAHPYKCGWCGNDLFPEALSEADRATAISLVRKLGGRLAQEWYKGFLEIDVLVDLDTGAVYLGELNPRISDVSSMTNVTAGAYADVPLFLFHLLEFMDVDYMIDVEEINERWSELAAVDVWSQLIMKEPVDSVEHILAAPRTGAWHLTHGGTLTFDRVSNDWHEITGEDEAFFMRVYPPGDFRFHGADLGILVTKSRMQTADGLTERCPATSSASAPTKSRRSAGRTGSHAHRICQVAWLGHRRRPAHLPFRSDGMGSMMVARLAGRHVQRIGLWATMGNPGAAPQLAAGLGARHAPGRCRRTQHQACEAVPTGGPFGAARSWSTATALQRTVGRRPTARRSRTGLRWLGEKCGPRHRHAAPGGETAGLLRLPEARRATRRGAARLRGHGLPLPRLTLGRRAAPGRAGVRRGETAHLGRQA
jgi:hypothetical protein